ncbi:MAG: hypothetical protein E5Y12_21655 [Mesorhizobium sp.]|nr:MAG: hypothetical protein E5Y12_21655 [Mesorhizobium sp.]
MERISQARSRISHALQQHPTPSCGASANGRSRARNRHPCRHCRRFCHRRRRFCHRRRRFCHRHRRSCHRCLRPCRRHRRPCRRRRHPCRPYHRHWNRLRCQARCCRQCVKAWLL